MSKYNGMKRAGDWRGVRVVAARDMPNSQAVLPASSLGTITSCTPRGLTITSDKCDCCGTQVIISQLNYGDVNPEKRSDYTMPTRRNS
jgi:hypothetical protein